jgi:SH3 domain-containing YSC84-like protein 1
LKKKLRNILNLEIFMTKTIFFILIISFCSISAHAKEDHDQTLRDSLSVIDEIMNSPDQGISGELISDAKAILIFPTLIKAGFFVGGRYGNGIASMRTNKTGKFGPPAFLTQAGLSFGFQVGAEAVDLILLVMTQRGLESLLKDKFTLGADVAVSAGPIGRHAEAATDIGMQGEIYSYSRSKGAFAGISLKGTVITSDEGANFDYYGRFFKTKDILIKERVKIIPESGKRFVRRLNFLVPPKKIK